MKPVTLPCLCASLRRGARALTQFYEEALRPFRLRSSQFTILQALALAGEITQGRLGAILAMDTTTLTRTLDIMLRHHWISRRRGHDRREWRISLAAKGKDLLDRALPYWDRAQAQVRRQLGTSQFDQLMQLANSLTEIVTTNGDDL